MLWIKTIAREVLGLFVDDGTFAIAILVWLAFGILVLPHIGLSEHWTGPMLFAGLAIILVESAVRFSRSHKK